MKHFWLLLHCILCIFVSCNGRHQTNESVGCNIATACTLPINQLLNYLYEIQADVKNSNATLNQIEEILENSCVYTPLTDPSLTISQPGSYCLNKDVQGPISINSSDVVLHLNAHRIQAGTQGIVVGVNYDNIVISNGYINNTQNEAVLLSGANNNIVIENVCMNNCANNSSYQIRTVDSGVINNSIRVTNCCANGGSGFLALNRVSNGLIKNNTINSTNQAQILGIITLSNTSQTSICNTTIQDLMVSGMTVIGIYNSAQILIDHCILRNITAQSALTGVYIDSQSNDSIISNCIVESLSATQENVFGMFVNNTIITDNIIVDLTSTIGSNSIGIRCVGDILVQNCLISLLNSQNGFIGLSFIGNGTVRNCTVSNLNNTGSSMQSCFGLQVFGQVEILDCLIYNIKTQNDFVGIQLNGNSSIKNSNVRNLNNTNTSMQRCFGIQSLSGTTEINNCLISDAKVNSDFTAIDLGGPSIIKNSTINALNSTGLYTTQAINNTLIGVHGPTDTHLENCIIKDIQLTATQNGYASALSLTGTNIVINNCTLNNITSSGSASGIYANNIIYGRISDTFIDAIISSQQSNGVDIIASSSLIIDSCLINNIQGSNSGTTSISGISCLESSWGLIHNNIITNINSIDPQNNGSNGFGIILVDDSNNIVLDKNTINNIQGYGIRMFAPNCSVTSNIVSNCKNAGIGSFTPDFFAFNNSFNNNPNYQLTGADSDNYIVLTGSNQFVYGANVENY